MAAVWLRSWKGKRIVRRQQRQRFVARASLKIEEWMKRNGARYVHTKKRMGKVRQDGWNE